MQGPHISITYGNAISYVFYVCQPVSYSSVQIQVDEQKIQETYGNHLPFRLSGVPAGVDIDAQQIADSPRRTGVRDWQWAGMVRFPHLRVLREDHRARVFSGRQHGAFDHPDPRHVRGRVYRTAAWRDCDWRLCRSCWPQAYAFHAHSADGREHLADGADAGVF